MWRGSRTGVPRSTTAQATPGLARREAARGSSQIADAEADACWLET
jgi:hypothetical protein